MAKNRIVKFVEQYPVNKRSIEALELRIKSLDELCYPGAIDYSKDHVTSSNIQDTVSMTASRREKERDKLERRKRRAEQYLKLHDMAFETLNEAEKEVIRRLYHGNRYADGKNWLLAHGYAHRTIYRLREKGLSKMDSVVFGNEDYVVIARRK